MYVPPIYRTADRSWLLGIVDANPLAVLVTVVDGRPVASHVPVIVDADRRDGDDDLVLLGHMNRVNPQWKAIGAGCDALVVFTGPHGYVSPTVYGFTPAAPTWNFTAVHAAGRLTPLPPGRPTLAVIMATVTALEGRFGAAWDPAGSLGYFDELLPAVGAFTVRAERIDTMRKLSQEQRPQTRAAVAESFGRDRGDGPALAELMRACLAETSGTVALEGELS